MRVERLAPRSFTGSPFEKKSFRNDLMLMLRDTGSDDEWDGEPTQ